MDQQQTYPQKGANRNIDCEGQTVKGTGKVLSWTPRHNKEKRLEFAQDEKGSHSATRSEEPFIGRAKHSLHDGQVWDFQIRNSQSLHDL